MSEDARVLLALQQTMLLFIKFARISSYIQELGALPEFIAVLQVTPLLHQKCNNTKLSAHIEREREVLHR